MNLKTFLKEKRVSAGLTQVGLAKKMGLHNQFVSNWERGLSRPPVARLKLLTRALKVDEKEITDLMIESYREKLRKAFK